MPALACVMSALLGRRRGAACRGGFARCVGVGQLGVRAHLRAGKPLYLLADVPGDAVGRSAACTLFGETVRLAAGLATLARISGSAVQTLAITREPHGFCVRPGPCLAPDQVDLPAVLQCKAWLSPAGSG